MPNARVKQPAGFVVAGTGVSREPAQLSCGLYPLSLQRQRVVFPAQANDLPTETLLLPQRARPPPGLAVHLNAIILHFISTSSFEGKEDHDQQ